MDGFTVNLNKLISKPSADPEKCVGKEISSLVISDSLMRIRFTDGYFLDLWDGGQSCCESRYMSTDDNLDDFVGATFSGARIEDAESEGDESYGEHEVQFLLIDTSKGTFTIANHNEHNGYYGGFSLTCKMGGTRELRTQD